MKKADYEVVGVMSGTSLDGVDLCHVKFTKSESWNFEIIRAETVEYDEDWKERLKNCSSLNRPELLHLDLEYTDQLSDIISAFLQKNKINDLDAVCSHGHTALHQPEKGLTYQIGNLRGLASKIGQTVVCDFRVQDLDLGGQGAPLVPIGDKLLFNDYDFCLNLGGFANISFEKNKSRLAFDICPVNIVLNNLAGKLGYNFDNKGSLAKSGNLDSSLLKSLNSLPYYSSKGPKSLGIEWVTSKILPLLDKEQNTRDQLHTMTIHIAEQISRILAGSNEGKTLVTGGGAYNSFLIEEIKRRTKQVIVVPERSIIEFKEALIFGLLGVLRLRGEVNCLSSVTGASRNHSSGKIFNP